MLDLVQVAALVPRAAGLVGLGGGVVGQPLAPGRRPSRDVGRCARQPNPGNRARKHVLPGDRLAGASDGANAIAAVHLETHGHGRSHSIGRPASAVVDVCLGRFREGHVEAVADRVLRRVDGHDDRLDDAAARTAARDGVARRHRRGDDERTAHRLATCPTAAADAAGGVGEGPVQRAGLTGCDHLGVTREDPCRSWLVDGHHDPFQDIDVPDAVAGHLVRRGRGGVDHHAPIGTERL